MKYNPVLFMLFEFITNEEELVESNLLNGYVLLVIISVPFKSNSKYKLLNKVTQFSEYII
jgi:hypothetical protein